MVKPLSFKGDKKVKKRKHRETDLPDGAVESTPISNETAAEETWTTVDSSSDLSGPVMILLPLSPDPVSDSDSVTNKPTCLASDPTGTVFASAVENLIPETPARLSAEPSDVRQVWVVTKVPGENSGWTLKSHQGRYLSVDRLGLVSCLREAAGMEEVFWFEEAKKPESSIKDEDDDAEPTIDIDGAFRLRTSRNTYLSISTSTSSRHAAQIDVRGDAEIPSASSALFLRMQSRFKPTLKASKELKAKEKVSRKQLEEAVGRRLEDDEVRRLKKARREGGYNEAVLDARVKGRHDKFA